MSKTILRLRFREYWRIGEQESWLADMAENGLHLNKMGSIFAHFDKAEPKQMRYRLEVAINEEITPEELEGHKERGWDYVTTYNYLHIFSSPVERHAPELHTDLFEQSQTFEKLSKKLVMYIYFEVAALIIMIGILYVKWFLRETPLLSFINGEVLFFEEISFIYIVYSIHNSFKAFIAIRTLREDLIGGRQIDHHAPWKGYYFINTSFTLLHKAVVGLLFIFPFALIEIGYTKTFPEESINLPIVRLADVEQAPDLIRFESDIKGNYDWDNNYSYSWSPFAPVQYDTEEHGFIPGERWDDGYYPRIFTYMYKLKESTMADDLVYELITRYRDEAHDDELVEINHPQFDLLIVYEKENRKRVFASLGKAVMYVSYSGDADVKILIENIADKMHLFQKYQKIE
ncbi:DUF2812 domain-containing protein [Bacillus solimangrovi]|uniref:DUF2812 domain-containing protein n=1 Tax=Bacillus solimangrovi TaxID=1305675 RepID=A0A1E5LCE3_9BACI|nr:DUF2812 domain-containing protein [Bacillus solimangrovi]OEH91760.1 hypothetical protein BFG57_17695 [Bacillus solimangrovi]